MSTTKPEALAALIERLRLLPIDHEPDGWPAVRTRDITALLDRIAELEARVQEMGQMARDVNSRRVVELESELAAMQATVEPVAYCYADELLAAIKNADVFDAWTKRCPGDMPLYTHPPAAQEAEPDMFWDADDNERFGHEIQDIVSEYDPGSVVTIECAQRLPSFRVLVTAGEDGNSYEYVDAAIAAQQGEKE